MWIYLCDDDPADRLRTEYFLKQYAAKRSFRVQIQAFSSAAELLQAFQAAKEPPFLILLDILMSSLDGMTAAKQLRLSGYEGSIVFTTSSTEHALESYQVYADGFLAKPFTYDDFVFTMKRVEHLFRQTSESLHVHEAGRGKREIYLDTILYLEIENRHLRIYTTFESILVNGKISDFASALEGRFIRIGYSYLVNPARIQEIRSGECILKNGDSITIPVRCRNSVCQEFYSYLKQFPQEVPS